MFTLFTLAADTLLGRVSSLNISDQTCMELLVQNLSKRVILSDFKQNGEFLDIAKWPGVRSTREGNVRKIDWKLRTLPGTILLEHLPQSIEIFRATHNQWVGTLNTSLLPAIFSFILNHNALTGSVDLTALPAGLTYFSIANNEFSGECQLHKLPVGLTTCSLVENKFHGSLDLTNLPIGLSRALFGGNAFSGSVSIEALPQTLVVLDLGVNKLTGQVCLSKLPNYLEDLRLDDNLFTGEFRLENAPDGLMSLSAEENDFSGTAVIPKSCAELVTICNTEIEAVVNEKGVLYPEGKFWDIASGSDEE